MSLQLPRAARTTSLFMLATLGLMMASSADAQIFRCKDEKGQTHISDRPCGASTTGQLPQTSTVGNADRIHAEEMLSVRTMDRSSQYDFIRETGARSGRNGNSK